MCLYATYFCSTLNVSSEKLLNEMCRTQKSSIPSFSNPRSLGRSNHTDPKIRLVTTADPIRALMNTLFLTVTRHCLRSTDTKCAHAPCGNARPYCARAKGVASVSGVGSFASARVFARSSLALHAAASAFVVVGAFALDIALKFRLLPFASAFAGVATRFTNQSATSSPEPSAGGANPSFRKYAAAPSRGP